MCKKEKVSPTEPFSFFIPPQSTPLPIKRFFIPALRNAKPIVAEFVSNLQKIMSILRKIVSKIIKKRLLIILGVFNALIIRSDAARKIVTFFVRILGDSLHVVGAFFLLTLKITTSGDFGSGEKIVILHRI